MKLPAGIYAVSAEFAEKTGEATFTFRDVCYKAQIGVNAFSNMDDLNHVPLEKVQQPFFGYEDTTVVLVLAGTLMMGLTDYSHSNTNDLTSLTVRDSLFENSGSTHGLTVNLPPESAASLCIENCEFSHFTPEEDPAVTVILPKTARMTASNRKALLCPRKSAFTTVWRSPTKATICLWHLPILFGWTEKNKNKAGDPALFCYQNRCISCAMAAFCRSLLTPAFSNQPSSVQHPWGTAHAPASVPGATSPPIS